MKIALVSVGGLFYDIWEEFERQGNEVIGYIDTEEKLDVSLPYLGNDSVELDQEVFKFVCVGGIGTGIDLRRRLVEKHNRKLTNLIFGSANISRYAKIAVDANVLVYSGSIIRSWVVLDPNTFVNSLCNLGHHAHVGFGSQISNGVLIGGHTVIGRNCFIGQGANIFQQVEIGDNCIIGANALITKDVPDNSFVIGKDDVRKRRNLHD